MVHLNYLKPCFTPLETQEKPSREATPTHVEETYPVETLRAVRQPSQGTSGDVELEWLENPATTGRELSHPPHDREESGALSSSPPPADVRSQPESSLLSNEASRELCQTPAIPRHEQRQPVWLRDYSTAQK